MRDANDKIHWLIEQITIMGLIFNSRNKKTFTNFEESLFHSRELNKRNKRCTKTIYTFLLEWVQFLIHINL